MTIRVIDDNGDWSDLSFHARLTRIWNALLRFNGSRKKACAALGIDRVTLYRACREYDRRVEKEMQSQ